MATLSPDVSAALAALQARWGAAAPRLAGEVVGSLAMAPLPDVLPEDPEADPADPADPADRRLAPLRAVPRPGEDQTRPLELPSYPDDGSVIRTGFAALDAILGPGGL